MNREQNEFSFEPCDLHGLGRRFREVRMSRGVSQERMAEILHINTDSIGKMERGVRGCSIDVLLNAAKYLQVGTDYLLGLECHDPVEQREQILGVIGTLAQVAREI